MKKKLDKALSRFFEHFGYHPKFPPNIDFDQDAYAILLDECVNKNFDYTIKEYGTIPSKPYWKHEFSEILID